MFKLFNPRTLLAITIAAAINQHVSAEEVKATFADAMAVAQEVSRECKLTRSELITVPKDVNLETWGKTRAQYLNDPIEWEKFKKNYAPCWTKKRWQRYVAGVWANYDATGLNARMPEVK